MCDQKMICSLYFEEDYRSTDDVAFIDQFLCLGDPIPEDEPAEEVGLIEQIPMEEEKKAEIIEEPIVVEKVPKKRSTFHNFQKHLVTTIRLVINANLLGSDPETRPCERKLWKSFMNSNKINKTLVTFVLGEISLDDLNKFTGYGFEEVLREFNLAQIREAQRNLAQEVIRQLKEADMSSELEGRRMKNKQEFIVYFRAFMDELENGELDKRMAKCTKLLKTENL